MCCAVKCLFDDEDDYSSRRAARKSLVDGATARSPSLSSVMPAQLSQLSQSQTNARLIAEYNELAARIKANNLEAHVCGAAEMSEMSTVPPPLPTTGGTSLRSRLGLDTGSNGRGSAGEPSGKNPRVRWLPLRGRTGGARGGGSYMKASAEEGAGLCAPRYDIGGASSEEGSDGGDAYGNCAHAGMDEDGKITVTCIVPLGGEEVFRLIVPSGSQVVVPLPEGTSAGDEVGFELDAAQLGSLPHSDHAALLDGRFHTEPGDGE